MVAFHSKQVHVKRVLITGAESTGKSELAMGLARHYGGIYIPEYAREYVEKLDRPCVYSDVEHIAEWQKKAYQDTRAPGSFVFFDTWLIITRVWFEVVFHKVPSWLDDQIRRASFDLVLLCHTDLPWISDGVRENGGERREWLQERYQELIRLNGWDFYTVDGRGGERLTKAIQLIDKLKHHGES
jgi:NadR type nicotinamide-nucleotide adenylyltransferase